jgi:peptide/nickel transport system ATP-binding protein
MLHSEAERSWQKTTNLLSISDLAVGYRSSFDVIPIVRDFSLDVQPGQIVGIAGESGSGKTTAVLAAIGYMAAGAVHLDGESLVDQTRLDTLDIDNRRRLWASKISYVAQDAAGALNPAFRIGTQLREILEVNAGLSRKDSRRRASELLTLVHLANPEAMMRRYPHQCSGGQLQRVALAMALASDPKIIVFDEPTTGLDVTTQAEVITVLRELIRERQIGALYISHDLALLSNVSDELVILYAGEIMEHGHTADILRAPRHPYTRSLLDALPSVRRAVRPVGIGGVPPGRVVSDACPFALRCPAVADRCRTSHPELTRIDSSGRRVRCLRAAELGPLWATAQEPISPTKVTELEEPLLAVEQVTCRYGRGAHQFDAVRQVTLTIRRGEVVALVGESGSGKTTLGRAIVGLVPIVGGEIRLGGKRLDPFGRRGRDECNAIQIIFQNPDSSLNPRHSVAQLIGRSLQLFRPDIARRDRQQAIIDALAEVRLDPSIASRYPSQLSGGQKQRVAIARAFVARPQLIVCDEIVSGQDVSVQAAILELVRGMQERYEVSLLFISHDLAVVRSIAQRVIVIRRGEIVESGPTEEVYNQPSSEYTRALLAAVMETPGGIAG